MLERTRFEHEIAALRQYDVTAPPGTSLYLPIRRNELLAGRKTGVYVTDAARAAKTFDVIVYFHGFIDSQCHEAPERFARNGIQYYWGSERFKDLRTGLEASGRAALLVAPTLHPFVGAKGSGPERHGDLHKKGVFDKLIADVLAALRAANAIEADAQIGHIVLAAHSGGGKAMHDVLAAQNSLKPKIRACWGFECLYYDTQAWIDWLAGGRLRRFRHFRRPKVMRAAAASFGSTTQFIDAVDSSPHCDLVRHNWNDLLATLPATPGDAQAAFELATPVRRPGLRKSSAGKAA